MTGFWCIESATLQFGLFRALNDQADRARPDLSGSQIPVRNHRVMCTVVNANLKLTHLGDKRQSKSDPPWAPFGIKLMPFSSPFDRLSVYL